MDIGAGDGGYVLHRARTEPTTFALAIDASPNALTSGAWRAKRARLGNAAFLVESVERLPDVLFGVAHEATVHFPWGSLLRGLVDGSPAILDPIARLLKPGGELRVLVSAMSRDGLGEVDPAVLMTKSDVYSKRGLVLTAAGWAPLSAVAQSHSAWAKRLAVGRARSAVLGRYRRDGI